MRNMLNQHRDIYCTNEVPIKTTYSMMIAALETAQKRAAEIKKAHFFNSRSPRLCAEQWYAFSKFDEDRERFSRASIIANKTPGAEAYFPRYESIFNGIDIRYVYCWRDPLACLRSNLSMKWSAHNFEYTFTKLRTSYKRFMEFRPVAGKRMYLFNLEEYADRPLNVASDLCRFLDVPDDDARKMTSLPAANTMNSRLGGTVVRELTEAEKRQVESDPVVKAMLTIVARGQEAGDSVRSTLRMVPAGYSGPGFSE